MPKTKRNFHLEQAREAKKLKLSATIPDEPPTVPPAPSNSQPDSSYSRPPLVENMCFKDHVEQFFVSRKFEVFGNGSSLHASGIKWCYTDRCG